MRGQALETIRWLGVLAMVIDHAAIIMGGPLGYRIVGRLALPCFVILLIAGMERTRDVKAYAMRLAIWGVIAQPIYMALNMGNQLNILFTLAAIVSVASMSWIALGFVTVIACYEATIGQSLFEYGGLFILVTAMAAHMDRWGRFLCLALAIAIGQTWPNVSGVSICYSVVAVAFFVAVATVRLPSRLPRLPTQLWYAFYPAHLAYLWAIRVVVQ